MNFVGTGTGPASLLSALLEVQFPTLKAILRIGACGGLGNAATNRVVVAEAALCTDVVSKALARSSLVRADGGLVHELSSALRAKGLNCARKPVASVDAMYLFERNLVKAAKKGAFCWDLESATTLAFGKVSGLRAASLLLVVSDTRGNSIRSYPPIRRLDFVKVALKTLTKQ